jgi:hypothetical protein
MGAIVSAIAFPHPPKKYSENVLRSRPDLKFLKTKRCGYRIPIIHIKKRGAKYTIIYSHGNAEDVGLSLNYLDIISNVLDVNVIAYEYPGTYRTYDASTCTCIYINIIYMLLLSGF